MRFLVLIIITITMVSAAEEAVKLPSSTEYAVKKHEQAIEKVRAAYIKSFESIKEDTAKVMAKEIEKATKSGDLQLALAIQAKAEEIAKSSAMDVQEVKNDLLGNKTKANEDKVKNFVVGKWTANGNEKWELADNGVFIDLLKGREGTWTINDDNITIIFPSGNSLVMSKNVDRQWSGIHQNGKTYTLIRE